MGLFRNSRFEARRAAKLLSAATGEPVVAVGVIVPVGTADIRVKKLPTDVKVVNRMRLVRWLESLPPVLPLERIDALFSSAPGNDVAAGEMTELDSYGP